MRTAVVIGGGVVGLSSAVALARRGFAVTVIESDSGRRVASWGNAGHIAVEQVDPLASFASIRSVPRRLFSRGGALALRPDLVRHWLPFSLRLVAASTPGRFRRGVAALGSLMDRALPAWQALADSLPHQGLLRVEGHFVTWQTDAAAHAGRRELAHARIGPTRFRDLTEAEERRLNGVIKGNAHGVRFEGTAQIADLDGLQRSLHEALATAGGEIVHGAASLTTAGSNVRVQVNEKSFDPDVVVVCAGVWSKEVLKPLGYRVPIIAERGYHIRSRDHDWPSDLPPVVFEDRSMIVTRYADCVQVASVTELGHVDAAPDPAKWERLERYVEELGLPIRGPFERWMGARPTLPDFLPAIGRSQKAGNLLYAFGHQHLGLTLAPLTADIVAALASDTLPPVPTAPFDLERFQ